MEKNLYHCVHCNVSMRSKPRFGSRQFQGGASDNPNGGMVSAMTLNYLEAISVGHTAVDKARLAPTVADPGAWSGWSRREGEDYNFMTITRSSEDDRWWASPIWVRQDDGRDLVLKITIDDYAGHVDSPAETLAKWFKQITALTPMEQKMYFCYLSGGHHWELTEDVNATQEG